MTDAEQRAYDSGYGQALADLRGRLAAALGDLDRYGQDLHPDHRRYIRDGLRYARSIVRGHGLAPWARCRFPKP